MKQKHILKWLGIALGVYLLYGVLTAILVPLPQKEAAGELWSQYEARLSTDASQERVRSIEDTDSALLWRLQLIESAEREVIFSTFDLRADGSGQDLMAALYGAAQRGVRVRIIVDGLNGFLHLQNSGVLRALAAEENVEVRFYDPIDLLRPWKLNYRLHDKYLIADGSKYILGGRNSNDLFLGSYQENQNIDRDVLVVSDGGEGSSVSQLLTYFESVWSQPENKTITGKTSSQTDALQERYAALCAVHGKELAAVDWEVETAAVTHVSLLSGSPRAEAKAPELWDALVRLMAQGDDILLQTPYIICNDKMYNDLEALAETRQLRVLTNAVENGEPERLLGLLTRKAKYFIARRRRVRGRLRPVAAHEDNFDRKRFERRRFIQCRHAQRISRYGADARHRERGGQCRAARRERKIHGPEPPRPARRRHGTRRAV